MVGSISAVFSSPVFDPPEKEGGSGVSAGSIPEQRLVLEPKSVVANETSGERRYERERRASEARRWFRSLPPIESLEQATRDHISRAL